MNAAVYESFLTSIKDAENNTTSKIYNNMCLKCTNRGPRDSGCKHINTMLFFNTRTELKYKCVLPKGHSGKCSHTFDKLFMAGKVTSKLKKMVKNKIFDTPGNDDYVFKNRASRLFKYALSTTDGKHIRNKKEKKSCAIPLKDASTPILLTQAYLDWMTFILNIQGIDKLIDDKYLHYESIKQLVSHHKLELVNYYKKYNRIIFDNEGNSICVITKKQITIDDISDISRDNRVSIRDTDIQMGHCIPRADSTVTIRGLNLLPMSRRGNLIIGEHLFIENKWLDELKEIINNN